MEVSSERATEVGLATSVLGGLGRLPCFVALTDPRGTGPPGEQPGTGGPGGGWRRV